MGVAWAEFVSTSKVQLTTSKRYHNYTHEGPLYVQKERGVSTVDVFQIVTFVCDRGC